MPTYKVKVKWGKELFQDVEVNTEEEPMLFKVRLLLSFVFCIGPIGASVVYPDPVGSTSVRRILIRFISTKCKAKLCFSQKIN
jgi:hypothetical protein